MAYLGCAFTTQNLLGTYECPRKAPNDEMDCLQIDFSYNVVHMEEGPQSAGLQVSSL